MATKHSPDKTMNLAIELQQFLDETLQGATDEVSDDVENNEPDNKEGMMVFLVRKDGLAYEVHVVPTKAPPVEPSDEKEATTTNVG